MTDDPDGPDDTGGTDLGGRTPDEIDDAVRRAVGAVAPDRFAELVARAVATPQHEEADPADDLAARRLRRQAGGRRVGPVPRWLGIAAAVVLVLGVGVVVVGALTGDAPGGEVASPGTSSAVPDQTTRPPTDSVPSSGPPSTRPPSTRPPACSFVDPDPATVGGSTTEAAGNGFASLTFRCSIRSGPDREPSPLVSHDRATSGATAGPGEVLCVQFDDPPAGIQVVSVTCGPTPVTATAERPGAFVLRYRVRSCAPEGGSCGPASAGVGTFLLDAS